MALSVKPLSENLGAEVSGVDLSESVDEGTFSEILDAFHRYQLLRFPKQTLTPWATHRLQPPVRRPGDPRL